MLPVHNSLEHHLLILVTVFLCVGAAFYWAGKMGWLDDDDDFLK